MATSVTIHGGQGSDTISFAFTVTGTHTTFYAQQFANNVNTLLGTLTGGGDSITPVQSGTIATPTGGMTPVYLLEAPTVGGGPSPTYTIDTYGYLLDTISGGATINLTDTVGDDTVLVAAINAQATITGNGNDNQITFVTGENEYIGTNDGTGDTLVGGSGYDTIYTSATGSTTVNSGTGSLTAYLQDTAPSGGINDIVWIDDGAGTVYANGVDDAVITTVGSQTIFGDSIGSTLTNTYLGVDLINRGSPNAPLAGNNTVNALTTDTVAVFDNTADNTIIGGSGILYFIGGDSITATVHAGTGNAYLFAGSGDSVTLGALGDTVANPASVYFVSGGNATLSGAAETGTLYAFAGGSGDSLSGGTGFNVLTASGGSETLTGGTAASSTNYFNIDYDQSNGATLVLNDFSLNGSSALVLGGGFTQADVAKIEDATGNGGNLSVTLSDGAQLTFTGITTGSQLTGHIILT
jgi:hypothetical protein